MNCSLIGSVEMGQKNNFQLTGIERIKFAVENLADGLRFANDWGLTEVAADQEDSHLFVAVDGSQIEIVLADPARPDRTPMGNTSGMCEVTWGVQSSAGIEALSAELSTDREVSLENGVLRCQDDLGINLAFRIAQRQTVPYAVTQFNAPGQPKRLNSRAPMYKKAAPHEISHLAIGVDNAGEAIRFYTDRLGFIVSDRYADRGVFLRCSVEGNHHHVFFMNGKQPGIRFNHLAFKVRDIHEVIGGGQFIDAQGWKTFAGPGRHRVSSACFWYFLTPFGGAWEYAADEDIVTEEWESTDFTAEAHIFSEWTFGLEKSDGTLKGPISQSKAEELKS